MSFTTGLSGLNAATRRLEAAALDVARASAQRPGATPDAGQAAGPPAAAGAPAPQLPAAPRPPGDASPAEADLPRAMVDMISASAAFLANLQTIRRTDESLRSLLEPRR